ncbi:MAG: hypothetical protein ABJE95_25425 [Byssovorax sp.]
MLATPAHLERRSPRSRAPMSEFNPYAPPAAGTEDPEARPRRKSRKKKKDSDGSGCWQADRLVVLEKHDGALPDRCVVCNRKTSFKLTKQFLWHPPMLYLLVLAGWLIYFIAAAIVRKNATVAYGLCKEHQAERKKDLTTLWVGVGGSSLAMIFGAVLISGWVAALGAVSVGVFAIVYGRRARVISATKISDTLVWMKAGVPFVDSLPESPDDD